MNRGGEQQQPDAGREAKLAHPGGFSDTGVALPLVLAIPARIARHGFVLHVGSSLLQSVRQTSVLEDA